MKIVVSQCASGQVETFKFQRKNGGGYFNRQQSQSCNQNSLTYRDLMTLVDSMVSVEVKYMSSVLNSYLISVKWKNPRSSTRKSDLNHINGFEPFPNLSQFTDQDNL